MQHNHCCFVAEGNYDIVCMNGGGTASVTGQKNTNMGLFPVQSAYMNAIMKGRKLALHFGAAH